MTLYAQSLGGTFKFNLLTSSSDPFHQKASPEDVCKQTCRNSFPCWGACCSLCVQAIHLYSRKRALFGEQWGSYKQRPSLDPCVVRVAVVFMCTLLLLQSAQYQERIMYPYLFFHNYNHRKGEHLSRAPKVCHMVSGPILVLKLLKIMGHFGMDPKWHAYSKAFFFSWKKS